MGFIDRVKETFKNLINRKPQLPENTNYQSDIQTQNLNSTPSSNFLRPEDQDQNLQKVDPKTMQFMEQQLKAMNATKPLPKIDEDILSFLDNYSDIIATNPQATAYKALTTIEGTPVQSQEYYQNQTKEQELLQQIQLSPDRYKLISTQPDSNNNPSFYHIQTPGFTMPNPENIIRFYLNCKHENIAELAQAILAYNQSQNFYLKFTSNIQDYNNPRGEKIVIYSDSLNANYTMELLNYIKQVHPNLMEYSQKTLPFMKSVDGLASVAPEVLSGEYTNLYNQKKQIAPSANNFISQILKDSYIGACRDIANTDPKINFLLNSQDENLFVQNYQYIKYYHQKELLSNMKEKMKVLAIINHVDIDGIYHEGMEPQQREGKEPPQREDNSYEI